VSNINIKRNALALCTVKIFTWKRAIYKEGKQTGIGNRIRKFKKKILTSGMAILICTGMAPASGPAFTYFQFFCKHEHIHSYYITMEILDKI